MRGWLVLLSAGSLAACGVFGAKDDPVDPPAALDPAPPPVGGPAPAGVFVSRSKGADNGSGTQEFPLKTLAAGLLAAKAQGLQLIVCAEGYQENLVVPNGVTAFGYYDCSQSPWVRGTKRAVVQPQQSPAVLVRGITAPTTLEGFEIYAPDLASVVATETSGSSIALEVRESKGFTMRESLLHAGNAAHGTDGAAPVVNKRVDDSNGLPANPQNYRTCNPMLTICEAVILQGPLGGATNCAVGPAGGPGGQAGPARWFFNGSESTGPYDFRGQSYAATAATAVGGLNVDANGGGIGLPGAPGAQGGEGMDGTNGDWSLTAKGFVRGNGTAGGSGLPGQGGGGGGGARNPFDATGHAISVPNDALYFASPSGAGGGAGGCAGLAGTPGTGGGASIGALVIDSGVTFERTRIEASTGGHAGKGNLGSQGTNGTFGGVAVVRTVEVTGHGGNGGKGGNGGASGHGAPGPSIALAYSKQRPSKTDVDLVPSSANALAAGQPELSAPASIGGVAGTKTLPAVVGVSIAEYEIKE